VAQQYHLPLYCATATVTYLSPTYFHHYNIDSKRIGLEVEFLFSDTWPLHLRNTFRSIDTLGYIRYLSYDDEIPAPHSTSAWRREIKLRAKQISDTANRLYHEKPSQLTWRLELEKLVDARFCLRTEWYELSDMT
jgi:hypothetical protein